MKEFLLEDSLVDNLRILKADPSSNRLMHYTSMAVMSALFNQV